MIFQILQLKIKVWIRLHILKTLDQSISILMIKEKCHLHVLMVYQEFSQVQRLLSVQTKCFRHSLNYQDATILNILFVKYIQSWLEMVQLTHGIVTYNSDSNLTQIGKTYQATAAMQSVLCLLIKCQKRMVVYGLTKTIIPKILDKIKILNGLRPLQETCYSCIHSFSMEVVQTKVQKLDVRHY